MTQKFTQKDVTDLVVSRFNSKYRVDDVTGCWLWTASLTTGDYGQMKGKYIGNYLSGRAHVISYVIHKGDIPEGLCVLHTCDVRQCVNPDHLWLGTKKQNTQDMINKGRKHIPVVHGSRNPNATLTEEQVLLIRDDFTLTAKKLAAIYGVSKVTIDSIRERQTWKHLI